MMTQDESVHPPAVEHDGQPGGQAAVTQHGQDGLPALPALLGYME